MSPTIHREGSYRFYFFSREEPRMHVHVQCPAGEAKYWLEPTVLLAQNRGLSGQQLREIRLVIERKLDAFRDAWQSRFGS